MLNKTPEKVGLRLTFFFSVLQAAELFADLKNILNHIVYPAVILFPQVSDLTTENVGLLVSIVHSKH